MIKAAAYTRVSTERQAEEDKVSLDEQSKEIDQSDRERPVDGI